MSIEYIIVAILVILAGIYVIRRYVFEGYADMKVKEVEQPAGKPARKPAEKPAGKPAPNPVPEKMEPSKQEIPQPPPQKALVDMPPITKPKGPDEPAPNTAPLPKQSELAEKAQAVAKPDAKPDAKPAVAKPKAKAADKNPATK